MASILFLGIQFVAYLLECAFNSSCFCPAVYTLDTSLYQMPAWLVCALPPKTMRYSDKIVQNLNNNPEQSPENER